MFLSNSFGFFQFLLLKAQARIFLFFCDAKNLCCDQKRCKDFEKEVKIYARLNFEKNLNLQILQTNDYA